MDRIVINSNGKDTVLADWTDVVREGVGIDTEVELQTVKLFRGDGVKIYDRKNESYSTPLIVIQEWATDLKSFDWFTGARRYVPHVGDITWTTKDRTGSFVRFFKGAGVKVSSMPRIGVSTFTRYTFIGGQITTS